MFSGLVFRLRALFRRSSTESELSDELRFHEERQLNKYLQSGLSESESRRRIRLEFGGMEQVKEECRDARGLHLVDVLIHDTRYAVRTLSKSPGFTLVALLTLALGIGANTAIFSVVYDVLLRPLPYKDASKLVVLDETTPKVGLVSVSYPDFLDFRAQAHSISEMALVAQVGFNLGGIAQPESISGEAVSPNFLSLLGIRPLLGRDFNASEEKAGATPVVLLSYTLWQSHFAGSPGVVGRSITLDGSRFTIAGVLPPEFRGPDKIDLLEPIGVWATNNAAATERGNRGDTVVIGRLAPGATLRQARAEMESVAARLAKTYPATNDQFSVSLRPLRDVFVENIRPALLVLLCAVAFVLLIACANVANLCLMRATRRRKEIALRIAIGAGRGRIACQMLVESLVLAIAGGILGVAAAAAGVRALTALIPAGAGANFNAPVLAFAAGLVLLSTVTFGLAPALHAVKQDVQHALRESTRTATAGRSQNRWRGVLAAAEISLALVLLVGAGLMMKSLYRLLSVDPGFHAQRVLTMEIDLRTAEYEKDAAVLNFWNRVLNGVRALPGVESAAVGTGVPMTGDHSRSDVTIEGMALPKPGSFPHPDIHVVSPDYVSTLGIPLIAGRTFLDTDSENAPRVAMVNASLAQQFFPGGNAVGKRIMRGHPSAKPAAWMTIVGVLSDTKMYGLANPSRLEVYVPFRQSVRNEMNLVVKSAVDPAALTSAVRGVIRTIDKEQPVTSVSTMKQLMAASVSTPRITLTLLGCFSGIALVLAAIGIYGVISYSVAQRTHEIGIRLALGARRETVLRMVLSEGARIAAAGIAIGIVAALALTRLLANLLFSVGAADPLTFGAVAVILIAVALLASYIPARRTTRFDPTVALRSE